MAQITRCIRIQVCIDRCCLRKILDALSVQTDDRWESFISKRRNWKDNQDSKLDALASPSINCMPGDHNLNSKSKLIVVTVIPIQRTRDRSDQSSTVTDIPGQVGNISFWNFALNPLACFSRKDFWKLKTKSWIYRKPNRAKCRHQRH